MLTTDLSLVAAVSKVNASVNYKAHRVIVNNSKLTGSNGGAGVNHVEEQSGMIHLCLLQAHIAASRITFLNANFCQRTDNM
jgi:hypothetical protein